MRPPWIASRTLPGRSYRSERASVRSCHRGGGDSSRYHVSTIRPHHRGPGGHHAAVPRNLGRSGGPLCPVEGQTEEVRVTCRQDLSDRGALQWPKVRVRAGPRVPFHRAGPCHRAPLCHPDPSDHPVESISLVASFSPTSAAGRRNLSRQQTRYQATGQVWYPVLKSHDKARA